MKRFSFLLCLIVAGFVSFSQPANDECNTATVITLSPTGSFCLTGTNVGADSTTYVQPYPCGITVWPNDVWYTFTSTGTINTITVKPSGANPAQQLAINVESGSCAQFDALGNYCGEAANNTDSLQIIQVNSAGTQFFIEVSSFAGEGTFDLCVTSVNPPPGPGGSCDSANAVCDLSPFTLNEATLGAVSDTPSCFAPFSAPNSTWYKFSVNQSGTLAWTCTPTAPGIELDWALYDITNGCANIVGNELSCNYHYAFEVSAPIGMSPTSTTVCPIDSVNTNTLEEICPSQTVVAGHVYAIFISEFNADSTGWDFNWTGSTFQIIPTFSATPTTICGNNGTVTITYNNSSVVSQTWNFGDGSPVSTSANPGTHFYAAPGIYTITLTTTSLSGCINVSSQVVTIAAYPTVTVNNGSVCNGTPATLQATASDTGGTYLWSPGGFTTSSITVAPASNTSYNVVYTSANNCTATGSGTVSVNTITLGTPVITNATCSGTADGSASFTPTGGTGNYTYTWNGNAGTNPETGLAPGTYTVVVVDQNNCPALTSVTIESPPLLLLNTGVQNARCNGKPDGEAWVNVSGGTPPYSYLWSTQATTDTINYISSNTYLVTVTDNNSCTSTTTAFVDQPTPINLYRQSIALSCPGEADGYIIDSASGGTPPYDYSATIDRVNFFYSSDDTIPNLAAGTYTVILSDNNGCIVSDTVTVQNATPDKFSIITDSTTCYGASYLDGAIHINDSLVNSPHQYSLDGGQFQYDPDFYDLAAGTHTIVAKNIYNCDTTFTVTIGAPADAVAAILPTDTTVQLGQPVQLTTTFGPYPTSAILSYNWSPSLGLSCIDCPNPLASAYSDVNNYTVTIIYNQSCIANASATIADSNFAKVFIPNSFTPNGDGNNDFFQVYGESVKVIDLKIFNRWGELVYQSNNVFAGWDGTYKGIPQNPGVFSYAVQITFLDNSTLNKQGSVTLLR